jgi:hypothetical protein
MPRDTRVRGARPRSNVGISLPCGLRGSLGTPNLIASSDGHHVIAAQGKIIKTGRVSVPARHVYRVAADDVCGGAHLDSALAMGTLEKRHLKFNRRAGGNDPRSQKVNAARADVARNERYGKRLRFIGHAKQAQRQRQRSARRSASILDDTHGVRGNACKSAWARFTGRRCYGYCVAFKTA